uniref:hypothetical protein n=1 Tax=Borreliella californiensis TaxID=373543 RepID=UPI003B224869
MIKFPKNHISKIHIIKEYEDVTIRWDREYSLFRKLYGKNKTLEDWLEYIKKEEDQKIKEFANKFIKKRKEKKRKEKKS